jgi:hypothetical protein|tara:strand:- start:265 stop:393 length:129 start_codon:yes stop_codon:yes gene_type:complete
MSDTSHKTIDKLFFENVKSLSFGDTVKLVSKIIDKEVKQNGT